MTIESDSAAPSLSLTARVELLKALGDVSRLAVVSALLERPHCAEELAERLGRAASTVAFHLRKLDEAGLVTKQKAQYYVVYALRGDLLGLTLRDLATLPGAAPERQRVADARKEVLRESFPEGGLRKMPRQQRKRRVVLEAFLEKFEPGVRYPEAEVNERIHTLFADHCTVRRMLVDEGLMARDGEVYWRTGTLPAGEPKAEEATMETRRELKQRYLETPKRAGVFQVKNTVEGKVLLGSSTNLHGPLNKHRFMLSHGGHGNAALLADWRRLGPEAFVFEELEVVEVKDDPGFSVEGELTRLEEVWMDRLRPLAPAGYNTGGKIRE